MRTILQQILEELEVNPEKPEYSYILEKNVHYYTNLLNEIINDHSFLRELSSLFILMREGKAYPKVILPEWIYKLAYILDDPEDKFSHFLKKNLYEICTIILTDISNRKFDRIRLIGEANIEPISSLANQFLDMYEIELFKKGGVSYGIKGTC